MAYEFIGGGFDEDYYSESRSGGYGVMCCSEIVRGQEERAHRRLAGLGLGAILPSMLPWSEEKFVVPAGLKHPDKLPRYKLEFISNSGSFKPKMMAHELLEKAKVLLREGNPQALLRDIQIINAKLRPICQSVGELTLVVRKGGGLHLLDFGSVNNKTADSNLGKVQMGIDYIRAYIGELNGEPPIIAPASVAPMSGPSENAFVTSSGAPPPPPM